MGQNISRVIKFFSASFIGTAVMRFAAEGWDLEKIIIAISGLISVFAIFIGVLNTTRNDAYKNLLLSLQTAREDLRLKEEENEELRKEIKKLKRSKHAKKTNTNKRRNKNV